ncbi:MAG TPA: alkaline phosphatase family protein [Candidatus Saccharimonadales bacterium]|nr:alkaline phosphatase family protein [Candidatus Saccharimonadales bacterium]
MRGKDRRRRRRLHTWPGLLRYRRQYRLAVYRRRRALGLGLRPDLFMRVGLSFALLGLTGSLLLLAAVPATHFRSAGASIGVVQTFGGADSAQGASLSVSPSSATAGGDLLVATIKDRDLQGFETVTAVTDSAGNIWAPANQLSQGRQADEEIWYAADAGSIGADGWVTVTVAGAAAIAVTVLEVAGAAQQPLDNVASAGDSSSNASSGAVTTAAQDIVVGVVGWNANVTPADQTSGFTTTPVEQSTVSNGMTGEQAAWQVAGGDGTQSYGATLSDSVVWTATIAVFDASGGSPIPTPTGTPSPTSTPTPTATPTSTPTPSSTPTATPTPTPTPTVTPTPSPTTNPQAPHVMVIMEENKGYAATLGSCNADPYLCSLASTYASFTNWSGTGHPSLPNYLGIDSGSMQGCASDGCPGPYAATDLGGQLSAAGIPWAAYMESMPSPCDTASSAGLYVKRHDPFVFFNDVLQNGCANNVVPYPGAGAFVSALDTAAAPQFVWVSPNLNNDMHDGTVAQGDAWLQANLAPVLSSSWFTNFHSTVIVTMDENDAQPSPAGGQIPMVVISNAAHGQGAIAAPGNAYGTLRAIEEAFGLGYLGAAADPSNGDPIGSF